MRSLGLAAAAALALAAGPASAAIDVTMEFVTVTKTDDDRWEFAQAGFSEGAIVTGFFTGSDLDKDGQLNSFTSEVTDFAMSFSGNSLVGAFGLGFDTLFGLVFTFGSPILGDDAELELTFEGIGASESIDVEYLAGGGPLPVECLGLDDGGGEEGDDRVAARTVLPDTICGIVRGPAGGGVGGIPEPATWAMMVLGFGAIGAGLRRSRRLTTA